MACFLWEQEKIPKLPKILQRGPFFERIPREIRDMVYIELFEGMDGHRKWGFIAPTAALRTCSQFYNEAAPILYSYHEHLVEIQDDLAVYLKTPHLTSEHLSTWLIPYIQHLRLKLHLGSEILYASLRDTWMVRILLRGILMTLVASGGTLKSLHIICMRYGEGAQQAQQFNEVEVSKLLSGCKELRVTGEVVIRASRRFPTLLDEPATQLYVEQLKEEIHVDGSLQVYDSEGFSEKTRRGMCRDLWEFIDTCTDHVREWPECTKKTAALQELEQALVFEFDSKGNPIIPMGTSTESFYQDALSRIEQLYERIGQTNFPLYQAVADRAKSCLYMRKKFFLTTWKGKAEDAPRIVYY